MLKMKSINITEGLWQELWKAKLEGKYKSFEELIKKLLEDAKHIS